MRPPAFGKAGGGPEAALHHVRKDGQANTDDLPVLGQPGDGLVEKRRLLPGHVPGLLRQFPVGPAERGQHFAGMVRVEQVDQGDVPIGDEIDLQLPHEPADREPEVVPDQDEALDPLAVAVPQCPHEFRVRGRVGMKPLFELVEDDEHLPVGREVGPCAHPPELPATSPLSRGREPLPEPVQQSGLGPVGRRFDIHHGDPGEPGEESGLDGRRLAATGRPVDQTDRERVSASSIRISSSGRSRAARPVAGPG